MRLTEYRRKRDFRVTAEPRGGRGPRHKQLQFVIQKHAASHLHYDFRLELDGVLKSWAVPKGPSLDPATKRLAMQVEDHPLEYGNFEGIIPQGEYGGGTVMLWDHGAWEPIEDGAKSLRNGSLKFTLHGEKLQGKWMLVRKGGKRGENDERHWFLFKERDEFANPDVDVTESMPLSVTTERDLDEIAKQAKRVWGPGGGQASNARHKLKNASKSVPTKAASASGLKHKNTVGNGHATNGSFLPKSAKPAKVLLPNRSNIARELRRLHGKRARMPKSQDVQLASLTDDAPDGDEWIHEIKFDGYRMLCRIDGEKVRFVSRNGRDWTTKFSNLVEAAGKLPVTSALLDGEVVVMQADGTTSFQAMQNAFQSSASAPFLYYAFDLLYVNDQDVRHLPIEARKQLLHTLVANGAAGEIRYSDHVVGQGPKFFAEAARLHLEGIISKRLGRPYREGRGFDWLKIKCSLRDEFVIGGFTQPSGSRSNFGALLLGYYDPTRQFIYAGRVGTGFDERTLESLYKQLTKLVQKQSPFVNLSGQTGQARGVTWIKPSLVAQIQFSNWTTERQLRHPVFQGLREDKAAEDVVREDPISPPIAVTFKKAAVKTKSAANGRSKISPKVQGSAGRTSPSQSPEVAGVILSHPDKLLYPDDGISKLDMAHYYEQVAKWMLPHVRNRLLSLVRCPGGSGQKCFFQKHPGEGASHHLRRFEVPEKHKSEEHLSVDDLAGLIALVQMGVLEIHIWGSQADQFEKPDRLIFDLDPDPAVEWPQVVIAAKEVRLLLKELGLVSFLKTTGGKGLHIVVPIQRRTNWTDAKAFCRSVADFLVAAAPDRYIATMSKAARKGKIFVDYLRNDRGATAIAPYSTRNRPGATVSLPITWEELGPKLTSDYFTIRNLPDRLAKQNKDPWADMAKTSQAITSEMLRRLKIR